MRRPAAWAILGAAIVTIVAVAAVSSVRAQTEYPIFTHDHFEGMMRTLGPNLAGVNASLSNDDFDTAKARLVLVRQQLATTITFWRDRERDDAIGFLRSAIGKVDALDDALSEETVDPAAVTATAAEIGVACQACHDVYREQDPATGEYHLKPGSVD
jgi:cytochrome c556